MKIRLQELAGVLIRRACCLALLCVAFPGVGRAELYINEIYIDPPGGESPREYVELRGTPNMSLNNLWLVVLENEDTPTQSGQAGSIDLAIDLSGASVGSNGFLVMRRAANSPYSIAAGTSLLELPSTLFENSGGTFMLVDRGSGPTPTAAMALDGLVDNDGNPGTAHDGLDYPGAGQPGWTILDSIGVFSEGTTAVQPGEAIYGRTYAPVNFGPEVPGKQYSWFDSTLSEEVTVTFQPNLAPGQVYVGGGFEIEAMARYGNSTGSGEKDWHATNVTDNGLAGASASSGIFAQAGSDPHGFPRPTGDPDAGILESESSQFIPYGTPITTTLGAANYPLNQTQLPWDYNQDGTVDAADYTIWRDLLGTPDPTGKSILANADRDGSVDSTDYDAWKYHFGESLPTMAGIGSATVPEPASCLLGACGFAALSGLARRR
ncbi:MAG: dockerin type I repeat-containing protein [Pirellulales bacterium]